MVGSTPAKLLTAALGVWWAIACPTPGTACVGDGCINVYSTAPGGGALTTSWNFAEREIPTFEAFCQSGQCLFSAIDPGFLAGFPPPPAGYHVVEDGVRVSLEVIARDAAATIRIGGQAIGVGGSALIGTTPDLHNHPSWQLLLPQGEHGEYAIEFRLTTDAAGYANSEPFVARLTNQSIPTSTPSPTRPPTPTIPPLGPCVGDCDGDGRVTIAELVRGVNGALGGAGCDAFDRDGDGIISISDLVAAVNSALYGCQVAATPTPTVEARLGRIQETIFSPSCATVTCHDSTSRSGNLSLEPGDSHAELVGVEPDVDTARDAGLLRVNPGDVDNSFLWIKLIGPPPAQGARMPMVGAFLDEAEMDLVRRWIEAGAPP